MSLVCKNCKAVYRGKISPYSKFVRCTYCDSVIVILGAEAHKDIARKEFNIEHFKTFLANRGISTFDTVSGILRLGNQEITVDEDGTVCGPEPLKSRAEKWIHKFMSQE